MTGSVPALSDATGVFSAARESGCATMFRCRRRAGLSLELREAAGAGVLETLDVLAAEGWKLSVGEMFGRSEPPSAYATGFAHDVDVVGVFEAPSIMTALTGTSRLGVAGWDVLFATQWLLGPREFDPVPAPAGQDADKPWGLFALWEWNDAWQGASAAQRHEYDAECDIAFAADAAAGINIAGRHRLDAASSWHHLGIWESPSFEAIDTAMREHTRVADFQFTTSRHYIGRRLEMAQLLEGDHV
jgi:hypothetical protein